MLSNFGERLRELRKERGISLCEMSTKLGISRNTLTNWERGVKEPHTIEVLEGIAKILNVPLKTLLIGESASDLENNPVIKDLQMRVVRLEQVFSKFVSY